MAFSLMSKVVSSKVDGIFKSDEEEKEPPSGKELKVLINQLWSLYRVSNNNWLITSTPQNIDSYPQFMNICYIIIKPEPIVIFTTLNEN